MNSISWMIYLASVCGNVGWILQTCFIFALFGAAAMVWIGYIMLDENAGRETWRAWCRGWYFFVLPLLFFGSVIFAFVPDKDTVYAIAASQTGEQVLKSPTGAKIEKALDAWLDHQISPTKKDDDK